MGQKKGYKPTEQARLNMSLVKRGKVPYKMTDEIRAKISSAKTGVKVSEGHKEKLISYLAKIWKNPESQRKHSLKVIGDKNPNWRGGTTKTFKEFKRRILLLSEYRLWRKLVFERDDYTCQKCGTRSGNGHAVSLESHHCNKTFHDILKAYSLKTIEDVISCKELWDIGNGQTLRVSCHNATKLGATKKCA